MTSAWFKVRTALCLLGMVLLSGRAATQTSSIGSPPIRSLVDERGIDLLSLQFAYRHTDVSIGQPGNGLAHAQYWVGGDRPGFRHDYLITIHDGSLVTIGQNTRSYDRVGDSSATYVTRLPAIPDGSRLVERRVAACGYGALTTGYTLYDKDGTRYEFSPTTVWDTTSCKSTMYSDPTSSSAYATSISHPNGETETLAYKTTSYKVYSCSTCSTYVTYYMVRPQSVTSNLGYQLHYSYAISNTTDGTVRQDGWLRLAKVAAINLSSGYCDPAADSCPTDNGAVTYTYDPAAPNTGTVNFPVYADTFWYATLPDGSTIRCRIWNNLYLASIKNPSDTSDNFRVNYKQFTGSSTYQVSLYQNFQSYDFAYGQSSTTSYDSSGNQGDTKVSTVVYSVDYQQWPTFKRTIDQSTAAGMKMPYVIYDTIMMYNKAGQIVQPAPIYSHYSYNSDGQLSDYFYASAHVKYTYDARGNRTQTTISDGLGHSRTVSASFDITCANPVTCNQPNSTIDPFGNVTDYTYDPVHGGVLTMTVPAAASGGVRPQVRTSYAQFSAYYEDASGSLVAGTPIYRPTGTSTCLTTASCAGTADEVTTSINYGATGVESHLLPVSTTTAAGDGSVSSTVGVSYDALGNKISEDGPLPGSADTTIWKYDAARRVTEVIGPDPDGAGPLHNRSVKTVYNGNGQPTSVASGYASPDGSSFVELNRMDTAYDSRSRKAKVTMVAGGVIQSRTDFSYDVFDRLDCTAVRMNPAIFATDTTGACTLAPTGSYGPDRITRNTYDTLNKLLAITSAYGLPYQRVEVTKVYDAWGHVTSITDARGNVTRFVYDDYFGDLLKTSYPSPTTTGQVSTTDYEQLTYDAAGRVTTRRLRDGKQISYTYDNLGRQTLAHMVNPVDANDRDIATSYDLLGRVTQVDDGAGKKVSFTYDALGRKLSESPQLTGGATSYQYDAAGRRTRLTWSDGFYVNYDYDTLGELLAIRENGATSGPGVLASFTYDDQGKPTGLTRGNGVNDSYSYDAASRLAGLTINQPTAGNSYSYGYNPAGQLVSRGMTNDAYAFTQAVAVNHNYTANGLNQYTASGAVVPTYDGRGNMTSAGSLTYLYDSKNKLTTFGSNSLGYDAMGRLAVQASPATRFVYDGSDLIAEMDANNAILRRYVHIPGTDNVLVWYEGADTSNRRWLAHDERGSATLITDASGASLGINAYDEYGIPQSTNLGRFQYTGQTWLPELGMYYYKARIYSPSFGRFMQTDPTGYDDGPNWYNYVHGDPIGGADSTGTRDLTDGEKKAIKSLFPDLNVNGIHVYGWFFGGGVTLGNDIEMDRKVFSGDFSTAFSLANNVAGEELFAHELFHVVQKALMGTSFGQQFDTDVGSWANGANAYDLSKITPTTKFDTLNTEQQAEVFSLCAVAGQFCAVMNNNNDGFVVTPRALAQALLEEARARAIASRQNGGTRTSGPSIVSLINVWDLLDGTPKPPKKGTVTVY